MRLPPRFRLCTDNMIMLNSTEYALDTGTSMPSLDDILTIVAQKAMIDRTQLTPETKLSDLNVSSLDMVEVVFAIEDKYGISLPFNANTNAGSLRTVGDVIALVEGEINANA